VKIRLLGSLAIDGEATSLARRDRIVLARLAVAVGRVVPRDVLIDALWGGEVPASADKVVQGAIVRLRRLLGPAAIETAPGGYRLALSAADVDVLQFKTMAARARELAAVGGIDRAAHVAGQALELWSGDGDGLIDSDALEAHERIALLDMRRTVEEEHLDLLLSLRGGGDLVERATDLVEADPNREQRWALLARAQYRVGRQADALRTIQRAQRMLRDELGLELSPRLADLEQRILHQDDSLDAVRSGTAGTDADRDDDCPYRGLLAYDVVDGDVFYGRERAVADALTRLAQTRSLMLVGPSGSGKSSVLRAGVVASLRAEGRVAPIVELGTTTPRVAEQLARLSADAVVVVDQFEELFTDSRAAVAEDELEALATWRGALAITLRSDHLDRLNGVAWLAELAERSLLLVRPPDAEDLRSAIIGPASATGLQLEPGLVELMLRDAKEEPGALPLLSHALRATWLGREGRTLTVDAYERAGGLSGAIAATADDVYDHLDDAERAHVRQLMVRLFDVGADSRPTRARVPIDTALGYAGGRILVDRLSAARLVVTGDDGLTVAHEALATAWPRLAEWLDLDRSAAQRRRHLSDAAHSWDEMGRPDEELYRGGRLADASEWRQQANLSLTPVESAFLDASEAHQAADRLRMQREIVARSRSNRRLRSMFAAAVVMLLVVVAAGAVAVGQSRRASSAQERAEAAGAETARQALLASAVSLLDSDRSLALLLLAEADRMNSDVESRSALLGAFVETAGFLGYHHLDGPSPLLDMAAAGDDELFAVDDRLGGWRVGVGDERSVPVRFAEPLGEGFGLAATDGDSSIAALYRDPTDGPAQLDVFDLATMRPVLRTSAADERTTIAVSPDGRYIAAGGGTPGAVEVIRVADGVEVGSLDVSNGPSPWLPVQSAAVAIGPDDVLYVAALDGSVSRFRLPTMTPLESLEPVDPFPTTAGLLLINDGATLIGHGWANHPDPHSVVARWDARTGALEWQGTTRLPCEDLAYLADEAELACTSSFGAIELLSTATGSPVGTADAQQGRISAMTAFPDGRRYATASAGEPTVGLWDTAGAGPVTVVDTESARHDTPMLYSPDGQHILVVAVPLSPFDDFDVGACDFVDDGTCFLAPDLVDGESGAVVDSLDGLLAATWVGDDLGYVASDGSIGLLDITAGTSVPVDASSLTSLGSIVDYDPVHQRFFYWVADGSSYLLDVASRRFIRTALPSMPARAAAFTADGRRLALVSNGELSLVDVDSGRTVAGPFEGFESVGAHGDLVVAGDRVGGMHVLDASSLVAVRPALSSGEGPVQEIEISASGALVMARSGDAVRLFDLASGEQLGRAIAVPRADLDEGAALRPDGKRLAVTADAGLAIWNLDPSDWYGAACRLAGRDLTREEWDAYIGDLAPYHAACSGRS
jgi:DNA-binding SARP family transcriptional activator/WD40 repeat protein